MTGRENSRGQNGLDLLFFTARALYLVHELLEVVCHPKIVVRAQLQSAEPKVNTLGKMENAD